MSITDEEIRGLRAGAQRVQNFALAALCRKALQGDEAARERIAKIIAAASDADTMGEYLALKDAYDRAVTDYGGAQDELNRTRSVRDSAYAALRDFKAKQGDATRDDPLCCQRYGLVHLRDLAVPGCRWFEPDAGKS